MAWKRDGAPSEADGDLFGVAAAQDTAFQHRGRVADRGAAEGGGGSFTSDWMRPLRQLARPDEPPHLLGRGISATTLGRSLAAPVELAHG